MRVVLLVEIGRNAQTAGPATHHGLRCRDGLDHHIAQRTGLDQLALARYDSRFDGQQFAAHLRPRQPGHLTDLILLLGKAVAEFAYTGSARASLP